MFSVFEVDGFTAVKEKIEGQIMAFFSCIPVSVQCKLSVGVCLSEADEGASHFYKYL